MHARFLLLRTTAIVTLVAAAPACGDAPSSDGVAPQTSPTKSADAQRIIEQIQADHRAPAVAVVAPLGELATPAEVAPLGIGTIASIQTSGDALDLALVDGEDAAHATFGARLPAFADGATHLEDRASGVAIDLHLEGATPVAASLAHGFVVHPRGLRGEADLVHSVSARGAEDYARFDRAPAREEIAYTLDLTNVAGLRLVAGGLELLDAGGAPRLRAAPPYVIGANGSRHDAAMTIEGCAFDASPAAPWGRAVTPPGARTCRLVVSWEGRGVAYPALVDPSWSGTGGGMVHARMAHAALAINIAASATLQPHYVVLVTGGYNNAVTPPILASAEMYDPATGSWAATAPMKAARSLHTMTGNDENLALAQASPIEPGQALVAGGTAASGVIASAEIYDGVTGTWTAIAPMNVPRTRHRAAGMSGMQVFVAGGDGASGSVNATSETYDPASNTWKLTTTNMASARTVFAMVGFRAHFIVGALTPARIVVAGGVNLGGMAGTYEELEWSVPGGVWKSKVVPMQYPVYGHTGTALSLANGAQVAAFSGGINAGGSTTRYIQTFEKDTMAIAGLGVLQSDAAYHATVATTANRMVLVGGETNVGTPNGAMVYRASSDVYDMSIWSPVGYPVSFGSFAAARTLTTATRLSNGNVLVAGGWALPGVALGDSLIYTP